MQTRAKQMTPKQQLFVDEYLKDRNATQAAIRAGYSAKTAEQQGSRLLSNVKIRDAVMSATKAVSEKAQVDAAWVLTELARVYELALQSDELNNALKALDLCGKHNGVKAFGDQAAPAAAAPIININVPPNPDE